MELTEHILCAEKAFKFFLYNTSRATKNSVVKSYIRYYCTYNGAIKFGTQYIERNIFYNLIEKLINQ